MKRFFLMGGILLIAGMVVFFSSFKEEKKKGFSKAWFHCINPGVPGSAASYEYLVGQIPDCSGLNEVCAVYADVANPGDPTGEQIPVEEAIYGNGGSLEDLAEESEDFTEISENVKLRQ